jgi:P-type E1-E2 ATPase
LEESGIQLPHPSHEEQQSSTSVYIAIDGQCVGFLALQDTIRPEAPAVVELLKKRGIEVTMLTGDLETEAQRVSRSLGISVLSSRQLPHEKKALVQSLQAKGNVVAMLGDGVNDMPAQAVADVGIQLSLSPMGSHSADAAGMTIRSPNLGRLPEMLEIAGKTMRQGRRNIIWAVLYNMFAVSLAMGIAEPWGVKVDASMAATMMAFSSATVMSFSLLLGRDLRDVDFDKMRHISAFK